MFICPVCKQDLILNGKSYLCKNNHCYDVSKKGYVNLLMSQASKTRHHGDDKAMAVARREFLNSGHYLKLATAIASLLPSGTLADIGCGECYYLEQIKKLRNDIDCVGIDISKEILEVAAVRTKPLGIKTAVASSAALPFKNDSIDAALSVFAPINQTEISRILKNGGTLVRVTPKKEHLFELKAAVYKNALYNDELDLLVDGFEITKTESVVYKFLATTEQLKTLFTMTPYYYKTSPEDIKKLDFIESLEITAAFDITIYQKK